MKRKKKLVIPIILILLIPSICSANIIHGFDEANEYLKESIIHLNDNSVEESYEEMISNSCAAAIPLQNNDHGGSWLDSFKDDSGVDWGLSDHIGMFNGNLTMQVRPKLDSNASGLWRFNETSGTTANDETTNNYDGTVQGANWVNGKFSNALDFDGVDDYVDLNSYASTFSSLSTGTLEMWFKWDTSSTIIGHHLFCLADYSTTDDLVQLMMGNIAGHYNDESLQFAVRKSGSYQLVFYIRNGHYYYRDSNWHHIAIAIGTNYNEIYVDGVQQSVTHDFGSASTGGYFLNVNNVDRMTIGRRDISAISSGFFDGLIDEVRTSNIPRKPQKCYGNLTTKTIDLPTNMEWDTFIIDKTQPTNTNLNITILNASDNQQIPGSPKYINEGEFDISYIDPLQYPSIKLNASLTGNNWGLTPTLHYWGVSWNNTNEWRDTFFGGLKIETKDKVEMVEEGAEFQNSGSLISNSIDLPNKCYYDTLIINKSEPTGGSLKITVLDAQTSNEISSFKDLTASNVDISGIDPHSYPAIKLKATYTSGGQTGALHNWSVNWTKNNAPEIQDITFFSTLNRTHSICVKTNLTDYEEEESALTFEATYKSPSDNDWQTEYISSLYFETDHWEFIFTPPADAELGQYSFRFTCNDTFQESAMEMDSNFLMVINNEPIIQDVDISSTEINRTKTVDIKIVTADVEIPMNELIMSIEYKSPLQTNWDDNYISNLVYVDGHWEAEFTPMKNADLGKYSFNIICNDTDTEVLMEYDILVKNNKPIIWEITTPKYQIYRTETMKININTSDTENSTESLALIVKYKNSQDMNWQTIPSKDIKYTNLWEALFTPPANAYVGTYDFNITCNDSVSEVFDHIELQVLNNIPTQPEVRIIPAEPKTNDNLDVVFINRSKEIEDPENLEHWYRWYIDTQHFQQFDNLTKISYNDTTKFQTWRCVVQPFDGDEFGPINYAEVSILNSPPEQVGAFEYFAMLEDLPVILDEQLIKIFKDDDNDVLTFTSKGQNNVNIEITQENGTIIVTPKTNWFGTEDITFFANDSFSAAAQVTVRIQVIPVNDLPEIVQVGNQRALEGNPELDFVVDQDDTLNLSIIVEDIDGDVEYGLIKYFMNISDRKNLYLVNNELFFLPENDDVGWHYLNISITDNNETPIKYVTQNIRIYVKNVNDPPFVSIIEPLDDKEFIETESISFSCIVSDIDLMVKDSTERLTFLWSTNETVPRVVGNSQELTNIILGPGEYYIFVTVTDSEGVSASDFVHVIINPKEKETPKEDTSVTKLITTDYLWLLIVIILIIIFIIIGILIAVFNKKKRKELEKLGIPQEDVIQPTSAYLPSSGAQILQPQAIQREPLAAAPAQELLGPSIPAPAGVSAQPQAQLPPVQPEQQPAAQTKEPRAGDEAELTIQQKIKMLEERLIRGEISEETFLNLKDKMEFEAKPFEPAPQLPPAGPHTTTEPEHPTQPEILAPMSTSAPPETVELPKEVPPVTETPKEVATAEPPLPIDLPHDAYEKPQEEIVPPEDEVILIPYFSLDSGLKPVQKEAVEHEVEKDIVVEEHDLEKATENLQSVAIVKPTEESSIIHEGDKGVWKPDVRGKAAASKEVLEQIEKLGELKAQGLITDEEFQRKKAELFS